MWGAIIGDLAGSIYEYEQFTTHIKSIKITNNIIHENAFYSDDTILTIAILDAIISNTSYETMLRKYGIESLNYSPNFSPYFNTPFSPGYIKWLKGNYMGESIGNGAMMRISPVGYLFESEDEVIKNAKLATIPSHHSLEAIECTMLIAKIIFWARKGCSKEEIIKKTNIRINYKPFLNFNTSCYKTIDNCLYAVFSSSGFEESIFKILSYGGDTDTNACIVGSMAEAFFGIDNQLIKIAQEKLPDSYVKKLSLGYARIKK